MACLNVLTTEKNEQDLRKKSVEIEVELINSIEMQKFFDDLIETMYKKDGIGLAAPQVGKLVRAVAVDIENRGQLFINPKIIKKSWSKIIMEEGCLSIPNVYEKVKRPKKIIVEYFNRKGEKKKQKFNKMPSRILQHEIDHLDGVLFVDKIIK